MALKKDDIKSPFDRLKQRVLAQAQQNLGIAKGFKDWSLNDIRDFQADLEAKCKSSISEKWFYTHLKNDHHKLPRIDVLNLLSQYCDYKNWDAFAQVQTLTPHEAKPKPFLKWQVWATITILILAATIWHIATRNKLVIIATDAYTQKTVTNADVQLQLKKQNKNLKLGTIIRGFKADTLLVRGAYYKPRKIYLSGQETDTLRIEVFPDDYALMLNFFSRSVAVDFEKRRNQLEDAIHEDAKIFQSHPQYDGLEMLNRDEFIDRLILPINSLQNLEILHIIYKDDKIYRLRFTQKFTEDENK